MKEKKIKILQAIRQGKIGGGETHVLELSTRLNQDKFDIVVLSFTDGPMIDELNLRGIRNYVISTERAFDLGVSKKVEKLLISERFDVIHAHGSRACSNIIWAAKKLKIPVIYTVHGWSFHPDQSIIVRKLRVWSEKLLTSLSDRTICVSKSNQSEGISLFNLKRSTVNYNAVDFDHFNPDGNYTSLRDELGITLDQIVVGYIVRITAQKDPLTLVKAMRKVVTVNEKILLLVVGEGDMKTQMMQMVTESNLQSKVIFLPFRTDIPVVLNAIDIYCLPSLWEGFPIGILEAMAMKKAVVTTPVNGNIELVKDGYSGLITLVSDGEVLADKILQLSEDNSLRAVLSENAYSYVKSNFGFNKQISDISKLYSTILYDNI